jgi:biopolymer transport protein TolR
MERHHQRHRGAGALNLVSLMDIFTILVFFLLVNSSEVEVLPNAKEVRLPESVAEERARETVVVLVTRDQVLVQGRPVAAIEAVLARDGLVIPELKAELERQTELGLRRDTRENVQSREVTIMGDRDIPYHLLKKVMATCTDANYGRLSFAVMQKAPAAGLAAAAAPNRI